MSIQDGALREASLAIPSRRNPRSARFSKQFHVPSAPRGRRLCLTLAAGCFAVAILNPGQETRAQLPLIPGNQAATVQPSPNATAADTALERVIAEAQNALSADRLPNIQSAKTDLIAAMQQLERFVGAETPNGRRWLEVLHWDSLKQQIDEPEPDAQELTQIRHALRQNFPGLEMTPFTSVRDQLGRYIAALQFEDRERSVQVFQQLLQGLPETVQQPTTVGDLKRQREIGSRFKAFAEAQQAPMLVQFLRGQFSQPNVRVLISSEFLARNYGRPVAEPSPVNENILGTQVHGTSCLIGNVTPMLVPNPNQAGFVLCLQAQFSSDSVGHNRGVRILSHGSAPVAASETVVLTNQGLQMTGNVQVSADLQTQILDIQHKLRIIEKVARKKAAQQAPLANSIAESRLENRLASTYHTQVQERIHEVNARLADRDIPELQRLGVTRPGRSSWSSNDYLAVRWKIQDQYQLAAPSTCPLPVPRDGIAIQVHQSAINNLIDPVMSGRLLRSTDLDDLVRQFTRELPKSLVEEANGEEWAITMVNFHPVEIGFADGRVLFNIRATDFSRGQQDLSQPTAIQAAYKIALSNNEIQLIRDGDVVIEFGGRDQTSTRALSLRTFFRNKFNSVFREVLFDKPLRPLDRLPPDAPRLNITAIDSDQGWLQILVK